MHDATTTSHANDSTTSNPNGHAHNQGGVDLQLLDRHSCRVVSLAEGLCNLPAVATLDWPDQAADCLADIAEGSIAILLIGDVDPAGVIRQTEAIGVASGATPLDPIAIASMRTRADRLVSIGFTPDFAALAEAPIVDRAEALLPGTDWKDGPLGRMIAEYPATGMMISLAKLGDTHPSRVILALVAPAEQPVTEFNISKLRAAMPLLVRRTLLAVGPNVTSSSNWLTERERLVLEELALGKSVRQIAEALDRSPHTVHDHVKSLHRKLNASSRGELIARALGHLPSGKRIRHTHRSPNAAGPSGSGTNAAGTGAAGTGGSAANDSFSEPRVSVPGKAAGSHIAN